jgi:hypothetical protein
MLGICTPNGVFLDLSPNTAAQLERFSPFFNKDDLGEENTFPFTFPYSSKNARELGLPNHYYTRRMKKRIEGVRLFDNNNFSYTGDLVITAVEMNVNDVTKSKITGYFLTGISTFFQQIKNKKLKDLSLGGPRQFAWTNNNPDSTNGGFWQHIHKTLDGSMDYSFAPVRNSNWSGNTEDGSADWMNKLDNTGKLDYENNYNTLAPQVKLRYVLQQVFEEHGWSFDYSDMEDEQWESLFMQSFFAVNWQKIIQLGGPPYWTYAPLPNITINLAKHVPPEIAISSLIIWLRNRYNWGFDFDSGQKVCRMFPLKDLAAGEKKDWTKYMSAQWNSDFSEDAKVFAFKNEIDSADGLSSAPDFSKITAGEPVEDYNHLPAAGEGNFNQVVYVWKQNQYFQCQYNETDNVYEWGIYADGIYNYEPTGNNESIETSISTFPVYRTLFRNNGITDFYGLFPLCEQEGNWEGKQGEFVPWGIRLAFHRGLVWEANSLGFKGSVKYPYLTSICFTPTQEEPDLLWSNVYKHEFNGEDKGIINYWWKDTLKYLSQTEVASGKLTLPRHELVKHKWSDVILLKNIPYIGQKITEVIPYGGVVDVELRRIG